MNMRTIWQTDFMVNQFLVDEKVQNMNHYVDNKEAAMRQSNIELLRILSMIVIIMHHFSIHGGFDLSSKNITFNRIFLQFMQIGGPICNNIFILISGYFLSETISLKKEKIYKLWLQIFSYSFILFLAPIVIVHRSFDFAELIKHVFPISFVQWGFASAYFMLLLFSPYINKLLAMMNKLEYQKLLLINILFLCIAPTFLSVSWERSTFLWFVNLYLIGGYIRKYNPLYRWDRRILVLCVTVILLFVFLSTVLFDYIGIKSDFWNSQTFYFYDLQRIPVLMISILLFQCFLKLDIGYNRIINIVAKSVFGIYLLHDSRDVRYILWNMIFHNAEYYHSKLLVPYMIFAVICIFMVCSIIELVRVYVFEKRYMKLVERLADFIDAKIQKVLIGNS